MIDKRLGTLVHNQGSYHVYNVELQMDGQTWSLQKQFFGSYEKSLNGSQVVCLYLKGVHLQVRGGYPLHRTGSCV